MQPDEWTLDGLRPANHPVLRLAQAAAFFAQDQFVMARTLACRTEADIRKLFCIDAPDYWQKHCPANEGPRRLGAFKAHIIGINLVAILQFAYGSYTGKEAMRDNALTLLEQLPAEENRYVSAWSNRGFNPRNAFETQALLQLATESLFEFFLDFAQQVVVDKGHMHQQLHQRLVEQREHFGLDNLFDNQRHCDNHFWTDCGKSIHDYLGRRCAGKEVYVAAFDECVQEICYQTIHVSQWQHTYYAVAGAEEFQVVDAELQVAPEVALSNHYTPWRIR